jgi:hypothetical protein
MTNFGLTQWLLGASSAVFPGALPQIDASQALITRYIEENTKSIFMKIALGAVSKVVPSLTNFVERARTDASKLYQDLGKEGQLTANVYPL